jgi:hypothetical protein
MQKPDDFSDNRSCGGAANKRHRDGFAREAERGHTGQCQQRIGEIFPCHALPVRSLFNHFFWTEVWPQFLRSAWIQKCVEPDRGKVIRGSAQPALITRRNRTVARSPRARFEAAGLSRGSVAALVM